MGLIAPLGPPLPQRAGGCRRYPKVVEPDEEGLSLFGRMERKTRAAR